MTKKTKRGTPKTNRKPKKEFEIVEVFREKMLKSLGRNLTQTKNASVSWNRTRGAAELMSLADRIMSVISKNERIN